MALSAAMRRRRARRERQGFRKPVYLGSSVNDVASGPGSQRKGLKYRYGFDPNTGRYFHDYGTPGTPGTKLQRIWIRSTNPLVPRYEGMLPAALRRRRSFQRSRAVRFRPNTTPPKQPTFKVAGK
jgi:hypothetical protein